MKGYVALIVACVAAALAALAVNWHPSSLLSLRVVMVTAPNVQTAKELGHSLVASKLAACVNIVPKITSIYMWNGAIQEDKEVQLIIKTHQTLFSRVVDHVLKAHPYDTPEVIALPVAGAAMPYKQWWESSLVIRDVGDR